MYMCNWTSTSHHTRRRRLRKMECKKEEGWLSCSAQPFLGESRDSWHYIPLDAPSEDD